MSLRCCATKDWYWYERLYLMFTSRRNFAHSDRWLTIELLIDYNFTVLLAQNPLPHQN